MILGITTPNTIMEIRFAGSFNPGRMVKSVFYSSNPNCEHKFKFTAIQMDKLTVNYLNCSLNIYPDDFVTCVTY